MNDTPNDALLAAALADLALLDRLIGDLTERRYALSTTIREHLAVRDAKAALS